MTFEEYKKEYYPNGCIVPVKYGNGADISHPLKHAFGTGAKENGIQWHKLSEKYPEADKLIRVHCYDGMEYICETCYYEPTEDEIGYGKLVINFYELNGEWVDDNDIVAWCEVPTFDKE